MAKTLLVACVLLLFITITNLGRIDAVLLARTKRNTCADVWDFKTCSYYRQIKYCRYVYYQRKCKKTCGFCQNKGCSDKYLGYCLNYKKSGHCTSLNYILRMKTYCPWSCGFCSGCADNNTACQYWTSRSECTKNPKYMLQNCKKSCGVCVPSSNPKCMNPDCANFKKMGYCNVGQKHYTFMMYNCAQTCGCPCNDKNRFCSDWARKGECQRNPVYMSENCKRSCGQCKKTATTKKPAPPKTTSAPKKTTPPAPPDPTTASKPGIKCGVPSIRTGRIVGGSDALPGTWPWHVAISLCKNCSDLPFCAGTLINNEWVVTAAHCTVDFYASELFVILGDTNLRNWTGQETIRGVKSIHSHEKYGADSIAYNNDIALLRLDKPVGFTVDIRPVCLPQTNVRQPVGKSCTVTGFGRTTEKGKKSPWLKQATVPLVPKDNCTKLLKPYKLSDNMLCAGYKAGEIDACKGDSGGPLVCQMSDKSWQLTGIVSWGIGCARKGKYGVYSDVQVLQKWINTTISNQRVNGVGK